MLASVTGFFYGPRSRARKRSDRGGAKHGASECSPDERSDIRDDSAMMGPACRGACHRARVRATRWLMRATSLNELIMSA